MKNSFLSKILIISLFYFFFSIQVYAVDVVTVSTSQLKNGVMFQYKNELITRCLELTEETFGPFEYQVLNFSMNRQRALISLMKGEPNNVYIAPADEEWDAKTIPISIPIRMGLLSYRLYQKK